MSCTVLTILLILQSVNIASQGTVWEYSHCELIIADSCASHELTTLSGIQYREIFRGIHEEQNVGTPRSVGS